MSELRSAKISHNEAGQLKDVYRKKCEAYLRQRKDIEEQISAGTLAAQTVVVLVTSR